MSKLFWQDASTTVGYRIGLTGSRLDGRQYVACGNRNILYRITATRDGKVWLTNEIYVGGGDYAVVEDGPTTSYPTVDAAKAAAQAADDRLARSLQTSLQTG